jgi:phosphomannomutase
MLRGDELGALLGEYIARNRASGILANSIVSSSVLKKIADHYSFEFRETLTGFKWLAKIPGLTFGYEEALGYCVDSTSVNDKDGISAALMLAQLTTELKKGGKTLLNLLDEIWARHGFHGTEQISVRVSDLSQISKTMAEIRATPPTDIAGRKVTGLDDLMKPRDSLPPTDGIRVWLDQNIRIIIRPSGTEAKVKCYIEVVTTGPNARKESAEAIASLKPILTSMLSGVSATK